MGHGVLLASTFLFMFVACGGQSQSQEKPGDDNDSDDGDGIYGGSGGSTPAGGAFQTGGHFPTPATGGSVPTSGAAPTGGQPSAGVGNVPSGGAASGGAAQAGFAGVAGSGTNPECTGASSAMPCIEYKVCPNLVCGLADAGRRTCTCDVRWSCTTCDFTNSPLEDRPAMIPPCSEVIEDEVPCNQANDVCGPQADGEYCACFNSPYDGLSWDCDRPPSTWGP